MIPLLLALVLAAPPPDLKRAKDRFDFGAYADAAGILRTLLAQKPGLESPDAVDAYRMLGISEFQLGDRAAARAAFVNLLSYEPDYALDAFLVPPPIVEFFDAVKKEYEPVLAPLRERRHELEEQQRLADEARRRLLAEEQARTGPPAKVVKIEQRVYLFNWLPFGAGQFQNGERVKGTLIASSEVVLGLVNIGAILYHNQIVNNSVHTCISGQPGCSKPPYTDADRRLLSQVDAVKYASAGMFWLVYAYGVWDAHSHFVPRIETEITVRQPSGTVKLDWSF